MTDSSETKDVGMDDVNLRYRPRVAESLYNVFIENQNFKRTININPVQCVMQPYTLESGSSNQSNYRFTCVLTPNTVYSNIIEYRVKKLKLPSQM